MKYYYSYNGSIEGPFSKHELVGKPISGETLVWIEGMTTWKPASEVPMFADILDGTYRPDPMTQQSGAASQEAPAPSPYTQQSPYAPSLETYTPGETPAQHPNPSGHQQPVDYRNPQPTQYTDPQDTCLINPGRRQPAPGYGTPPPYGQPGYGPDPYPAQPEYQQPPQYPQQGQYPPQPQYPGGAAVPPPYGQQQYPNVPQGPDGQYRRMPSQHLGWTLTGTILSGMSTLGIFSGNLFIIIYILPLVFGIIGLSKGSSISRLWTVGFHDQAEEASRQALKYGKLSVWTYVGIVAFSLIVLFICIAIGVSIMGLMYDSYY